MHSMKKASKADVDKTSASLSKAGPSKQPDPTTTQTSDPTTQASDHSEDHSEQPKRVCSKAKKHSDKYYSQSSSSEEDQSSVPIKSRLNLNKRLLLSLNINRIAQPSFLQGGRYV